MLNPCEISVVDRRHPEFPANVLPQVFAAPIAHVERRVGENEIGLEVGMQIRPEAIGVARAEIGVNAANGEVHPRQFPGGVVGFLPVNRDVAHAPAVFFHEFFRLHEHAARTAARIEHAAFVGFQHGDEHLHDALRGVELAAALAFRAGEFAEKVFIDAPEHVLGLRRRFVEADVADDVHEAAEPDFVEAGPGVIARQHAFERRILALNRAHRVVNDFADLGRFGFGLDGVPAGFGRQPEDIRGEIFVAILGGVGALRFVLDEPFALGIGEAEQQLLAFFLEGVGDVFQEDQAEADVLVFGGVHVPAHLVGGGPKLGFEVEGGAVGRFLMITLSHDVTNCALEIGQRQCLERLKF